MSPEQWSPLSSVHKSLGEKPYNAICQEYGLTKDETAVLDDIFVALDQPNLKAEDKTLIFLQKLKEGLDSKKIIRRTEFIEAYSRINSAFADKNYFSRFR